MFADTCLGNFLEKVVDKDKNKKLSLEEKVNQYGTMRNEIDEMKADSEKPPEHIKKILI